MDDGTECGGGTDDGGIDTAATRASLAALRRRIRALASSDGSFVVACARTGESPVPVDGYRFPDRPSAATAAECTIAYRSQLRELDPRTPCYDPVVHELTTGASDAFDRAFPGLRTVEHVTGRDWRRPVGDHTQGGADRMDGTN